MSPDPVQPVRECIGMLQLSELIQQSCTPRVLSRIGKLQTFLGGFTQAGPDHNEFLFIRTYFEMNDYSGYVEVRRV